MTGLEGVKKRAVVYKTSSKKLTCDTVLGFATAGLFRCSAIMEYLSKLKYFLLFAHFSGNRNSVTDVHTAQQTIPLTLGAG